MSFEYHVPKAKNKILSKVSARGNVVTLYFSVWASEHKPIFSFINNTKLFSFIHQTDGKIHDKQHNNDQEKNEFHHHVKYDLVNIFDFKALKNVITFFSRSLKQTIDQINPEAEWLDEKDWSEIERKYPIYIIETYFKPKNDNSERKSYLNLMYTKIAKYNNEGIVLLETSGELALKSFNTAFELLTEIEPVSAAEFKELKEKAAALNFNRGLACKRFDIVTALEYFSEALEQRKSLYGDNHDLTKKAQTKKEECVIAMKEQFIARVSEVSNTLSGMKK